MKKVGKVCYGKYEGGVIYKEDKNNFFIDVNNKKMSVIDLHPDPNYEIDTSFYKMSDKEAKNTGFSIGLGGFMGLMAFNGIKGSVSLTVNWIDGSYSNFEFDNSDDEEAPLEFRHIIGVLRLHEIVWKNTLKNYNLYEEEQKNLIDWVEENRKKIVYEILNDFDNWTKTSKCYELFIFKASIYTMLNIDIGNRVYNGKKIMPAIEKIANANTMEELENIYLNIIPTMKAKSLIENHSITNNNIFEWLQSCNGSVDNFSQFLDNAMELFKNDKTLEEIVIYMFKEQFKFAYNLLKLTLKSANTSN